MSALLVVKHSCRRSHVLLHEIPTRMPKGGFQEVENMAFLQGSRIFKAPINRVVVLPGGTLPTGEVNGQKVATVSEYYSTSQGLIFDEIRAWLMCRLGSLLYVEPSSIDSAQDWASFGVDSAALMEVVADMEDHYRISMPSSLEGCDSIEKLARIATKSVTRFDPWRTGMVIEAHFR